MRQGIGATWRVLIADDVEAHAALLSMAIESVAPGAIVEHVPDGREALHVLRDTPPGDEPDLVVLDMNMPRMTGCEVVQAVRHLRRSDSDRDLPPMVVWSSSQSPSTRARSLNAGALRFYSKPMAYRGFVHMACELVQTYGRRHRRAA